MGQRSSKEFLSDQSGPFSPFIFIYFNKRLMRKKILLILPLLLFAITQQLQAVTCNWGYCNSVVNDQFGSVNKGKGAIYIPAEISKMYEGKQLS